MKKEKRNKTGNVPNLRFKGFTEKWEVKKLGEVVKIYDGTHQTPNYVANGIPFYSVEHVTANQFEHTKYISAEVFEKENKRVKLEKGDILMTRIGSIGIAKYINWDVKASFYVSLALIKQSNKISNEYLYHFISSSFFQSELWRRTIHVAFPQKINLGEIGECQIKYPSFSEQQKIASFLTLIDERIATQSKIIQRLETLMQSLRERLFTQKLRFKDEKGQQFPDWEIKKLGELATRITTKNSENNQNVLTISAQQGLISQLQFFNKSVAAKDVTGYYLLSEGDFAYNKSYSTGYPMGAIKRLNRYNKGVVSTLYICFRFNSNINVEYMEHYFEASIHNNEIAKFAQEGARNHGLLNIGISDFFNTEILIPNLEEQTKISNLLSTFSKKVDTEKKVLEQYKNQKKFLLQNLFI